MQKPVITDAFGQPLRAGAVNVHPKTPYAAGDTTSAELSQWSPHLGSADGDYLPSRDTIVARQRDIARNSGWGASGLTRQLDSVIGTGFRPSVKPNWRALGLSADWAEGWGGEVEARFSLFANDPDCWLDAERTKNFNAICRVGFAERYATGDALALALWDEDKPAGRSATTIHLIDADRLSNPQNRMDTQYLRGGIELSERGAPVAYHIRKAHPGDYYISGARHWEWERVPRETPWGRRMVIHSREERRAAQTRGVSAFVSVIERMKMLDQYDRTELQAAVMNAILAMFIKSPYDEDLAESLDQLNEYQTARAAYHEQKQIKVNGMVVPTLFPGEELGFHTAARPNTAFAEFERACLRNIAAGLGMTYEQLTMDWSQVNYSSARAAIQEVWKTLLAMRQDFANDFATPIFALWLEEEIMTGRITLPNGAPDFYTGKAAYCNVEWIGAGRGYVDPEKEAKAANMRLKTGLSTLEDECAQQGKDWREVIDQRKKEEDYMRERGMQLPDWASVPGNSAVNPDMQGDTA